MSASQFQDITIASANKNTFPKTDTPNHYQMELTLSAGAPDEWIGFFDTDFREWLAGFPDSAIRNAEVKGDKLVLTINAAPVMAKTYAGYDFKPTYEGLQEVLHTANANY